MRIGGPRWLGLLLLPGAATGCIAPVDAAPSERGEVAIASYAPPAGAPAFCRLLADSVDVDDLPLALGTLIADPGDRDAAAQVGAARAELAGVLAGIPDERRYAELSAGLDDLLAAIEEATEDPVDADVSTRISTGLDRLGAQVQPVCAFPA